MELYIIRHGETAWNNEQKLQGRCDIPLNAYGIELAQITSDALADISFDRIYSSPLCRAYETAKILRRDRAVDIIPDDKLIEMSFGDYEGVPASEVPPSFRNFFDDPVAYEPPVNAESYPHILARAKEFIDEVIVPAIPCCERILVVAHGALNKALMVNLNHQTLADFWKGTFQKNCCVNIYQSEGNEFHCIQNGRIYYEQLPNKNFGMDD